MSRLTLLLAAALMTLAARAQPAAEQRLSITDAPTNRWLDGEAMGAALDYESRRVVLGAPNEATGSQTGAVYVFDKHWRYGWMVTAELEHPEPVGAGDHFGIDVALDGNRLLVGTDHANQPDAVYVFDLVEGVWTNTAKVRADDLSADGLHSDFGRAVALDGDRMLVGGSEAAYAFEFDGTTWRQTQKLSRRPGSNIRWFGMDLVLDGDRAYVAGVLTDYEGGHMGAVAVYNYVGGSWRLTDALVPEGFAQSDPSLFQVTLNAREGIVALGVVPRASTGDYEAGRVYVFEEDADRWAQVATLTAPDGAVDDRFGAAVGLLAYTTPRYVYVGAPRHDAAGPDAGAVYAFERPEEGWQTDPVGKVTAPTRHLGEALSGSLAGAPGDDEAAPGAGAAFFLGTPDPAWEPNRKLTLRCPDRFGTAVSIDGDRALVGAPDADANGYPGDGTNTMVRAGLAYVLERNASGMWTPVDTLAAAAPQVGDGFGFDVALDGDRAVVSERPRYQYDSVLFHRVLPTSCDHAIFDRGGDGTWTLTATLRACGQAALEGDRLLVGHDSGDEDSPALAYVYDLTEGTWTLTQQLAPEWDWEWYYGDTSVALDGDRALVGVLSYSGESFVFERVDGVWVETQELEPRLAPPHEDDSYGASVALDGDRAVVSTQEVVWGWGGSSYPFSFEGGRWVEEPTLFNPTDYDPSYDVFGYAVALDGDRLAVASALDSVFVFHHVDGGWSPRTALSVPGLYRPDWPDESRVGRRTVGLSDATVIAGAENANGGGGAVSFFDLAAPVAAAGERPETFALSSVYPNPVAATGAALALDLPATVEVRTEVFDPLGRRIAVLQAGTLAAGRHRLVVPTARLAPGAYVLRLAVGDRVETRRFTVVR